MIAERQEKPYDDALDIFSFFKEEESIRLFVNYLFDELEKELDNNLENESFIPPIYFNSKAKVFNINWHFLVDKLADFCGSKYIKDDFYLSDGLVNLTNIKSLWFGLFVFKYDIGYYSFYGKYTPKMLPV